MKQKNSFQSFLKKNKIETCDCKCRGDFPCYPYDVIKIDALGEWAWKRLTELKKYKEPCLISAGLFSNSVAIEIVIACLGKEEIESRLNKQAEQAEKILKKMRRNPNV